MKSLYAYDQDPFAAPEQDVTANFLRAFGSLAKPAGPRPAALPLPAILPGQSVARGASAATAPALPSAPQPRPALSADNPFEDLVPRQPASSYSLDDPFADLPVVRPAAPATPAAIGPKASPLYDVLRSGATGVRSGVEGLFGLPGDVGYGMRWLTDQAGQGLGFEGRPDYVAGEGVYRNPLDFGTADVNTATSGIIGPSYEPETTAGKYARTVGEFLPGAVIQPGRALPGTVLGTWDAAKQVMTFALAPGLASEAAGQATEGTGAEPYARAASALFTGTLANAASSRLPETAAQVTRREAVAAANRQGMAISEAAMSDQGPLGFLGAKLAHLPLVGEPLRAASRETTGRLAGRMSALSDGLGSSDKTTASHAARDSLRHWVEEGSGELAAHFYDRVDNLVRPNIMRTPMETRRTVQDILREQAGSTSTAANSALRLVEEAVNRPGGLNYHGLKQLRTDIGARLSGKITPEPGTSQPALKRIYGALTDDLEFIVGRSGPRARRAWERANTAFKLIADRRESLAAIVGMKGGASAEAVFSRIVGLAGDGAAGNAARLNQVRRVMQQAGAWDDMRAAVIARLGRDPSSQTNAFSPDRFLTTYGKFSDEGKEALFGSARADIDDLAVISEQHRAFARMGNPSGTGGVVSLTAGAGGLMIDPVTTLATIVGGNALAWLMSRPASARKMVDWARLRHAGPTASANAYADATRALARDVGEETGMTIDDAVDALNDPQDDPFADIPVTGARP